MHRIETTDPISGNDIQDREGKSYVVEAGLSEDLVIYFESEANRRTYQDVPAEHPLGHRTNLDNPTDIMIDEG